MQRLTGKLTRDDIIQAGGVMFFTNSTLETRMVLDVLRFDMGFTLANEAVAKMYPASFNGQVFASSDGLIWAGKNESAITKSDCVATIHNLIPDYVDSVTAQFNKISERLTSIEDRLAVLEKNAAPRVAKGASLIGMDRPAS